MKQNITKEQLNELSEKARKKLHEWWKPEWGDQYIDVLGGEYANPNMVYVSALDFAHGHTLTEEDIKATEGFHSWSKPPIKWERLNLPLLSIGKMIEFLEQKEADKALVRQESSLNAQSTEYGELINLVSMCDTLWEAVKEILEK